MSRGTSKDSPDSVSLEQESKHASRSHVPESRTESFVRCHNRISDAVCNLTGSTDFLYPVTSVMPTRIAQLLGTKSNVLASSDAV